MKQVYTALVLALVLVFALGSTASAGIAPGENYDHPLVSGGGGDDGDHPWGGDRIGDGGTGITDVRVISTSVATGYPVVDLFINYLLGGYAPVDEVTAESSVLREVISRRSAQVRYREVPAATSSRFSLRWEDR
jgi:hypothetical protein